jgi:antirestriction protein ArdC
MKRDVYQAVTDKIVAALEQGVPPWFKPWSAEHAAGRITRPLRANGVPYQGINVVMLWSEAAACGYAAPIWMTFKQALAAGGCVREGEKGSLVVYASKFTRTERSEESCEEYERDIPFLKGYTVFNVEQVDGLPDHFHAPASARLDPVQRIAKADEFFSAARADLRHGGNRAFYSPSSDHVQMPPLETFRDAESYYATLAHEFTHWTKHKTRLDPDFGRKK